MQLVPTELEVQQRPRLTPNENPAGHSRHVWSHLVTILPYYLFRHRLHT